jgi:peptidyl-prolyl cis-trans isomerase SurA
MKSKLLKDIKFAAAGWLLVVGFAVPAFSQSTVIDEVAAVVGNHIVKKSDIEKQYLQYISQGNTETGGLRCAIIENLLLQKLLVQQATIDSVEVSDAQVESELDKRIRYFVKQIGSEQALESYYSEPIAKIKEDFRKMVKEQLLVQTMQSKITKEVSATPSDVRNFFNSIPADSLPYISAELEVAHIMLKPHVSEQQKLAIRERLEEYRKKIQAGEDFSVYAALYSADRSTAKKGGELGFFERGDMVPEFEAAAFKLKPGEVSNVIETKYGFHLIQLIERRGNQINVRHILLQPEVDTEESAKVISKLDSIGNLIRNGSMTFEEAAEKFSEDEDTRYNGGTLINPQTGNTQFQPDQLDKILFFQIDTLPVGKVSAPIQMQSADGKTAYRIAMVRKRTEPHRANLKEDYQKIQDIVLQDKQAKAMEDWVKKTIKTSFVKVNEQYWTCPNLNLWISTNDKSN